MGFFKNLDKIRNQENEIKELKSSIQSLKTDREVLKEELAEIKHKKKIEEEDIKHMVKLKMEKAEVANEKKQLEREREKDRAIATVKDDYRDKIEKDLHKQIENMQVMYKEILGRLPDMSVRLKGSV